MRTRINLAVMILAAAGLLALGCSDDDGGGNVCSVGETKACTCTGGASGTATCKSDKSGWEACGCKPTSAATNHTLPLPADPTG